MATPLRQTETHTAPKGRVIGSITPRRPHVVAPPAARDAADVCWFPEIELVSRSDALVFTTDLQGLQRDDVRVHVTRHELIIEGAERAGGAPGRFQRTIVLPDGTDTDIAVALFKEGVLEVTIPMSQAGTTPRALPIG